MASAPAKRFLSPVGWVLLLTTVVVGGMFIPFPPGNWLLIACLNMAHAPAFAVLTVCAMRIILRPDRLNWWWWTCASGVFLAMSLLGAATEWLQLLAGRQASWDDFVADLAGTVVGLLWSVPIRTKSGIAGWSWIVATTAASIVIIVSVSQYSVQILLDMTFRDPDSNLLASFETDWEMTRWYGGSVRWIRAKDFVTHGESSLWLKFMPGPKYAHFTLARMTKDWSNSQKLLFDVHIAGGSAQKLYIKIHDELHNDEPSDRFNTKLELPPGSHRVEIDLNIVKNGPVDREMNMQRVKRLEFFTTDIKAPVLIGLDRIRIE